MLQTDVKKKLISKKLKNVMLENFLKSVLIFNTMSYKPLISKSCNKPMLENSFTSALNLMMVLKLYFLVLKMPFYIYFYIKNGVKDVILHRSRAIRRC